MICNFFNQEPNFVSQIVFLYLLLLLNKDWLFLLKNSHSYFLILIVGFPAKDFFEGKPQKTYIRLSHDEESFRCFLLSIYPKLEGKYYELYRIDRQRNLVRIEAKTPRGIKNAKYQGTIIILPYVSIFKLKCAFINVIW